ncbi:MAG: patatin-like phospholipase family protein [Terriglobia bacterium]
MMKAQQWKAKLLEAVGRVREFARQHRLAPPREAPRLGAAFGGGFARGLAHIGVLKVLEEKQVKLACLAGTSVGGIIAGAYASGATLEEIAAVAAKVRWKDFGRWTISRMGLASNHRLEALVRRLFRAKQFDDLRIPLAVVATDLRDGNAVVFTRGELGLAIRASCAYPGLFLPVEWNGGLLADGGLVATVPTQAAKELGAEVVVAVNLDNLQTDLEPKSIVDVLGRSFSIAQRSAEPVWRAQADIVVEPQVSQFHWDEFERAPELIAAGEEAMRAAWPRLERLLRRSRKAHAVAR